MSEGTSKLMTAYPGPWIGWSIQDGLRISENLHLSFRGNSFEGTGADKDGDFEVFGDYDPERHSVRLTRRYTWTTEPSQEGVGIPYEYHGVWDGYCVAGRWNPRTVPHYGGPFEMWPEKEEAFQMESLEELGAIS